ncbi:MAG: sulfite exporter TauE/SafE family protein [Planctomycetota bacterium]
MEFSAIQLVLAALIGGFAGLIGGMAGIGGSLIMLPGLGLIIGYTNDDQNEQHLYAAAAMVVNLIVSVTATRQHLRKGAVQRRIVQVLIPTLGLALVVGVLLSNRFQGRILAIGLAVFIAAFALQSLVLAIRPIGSAEQDRPKASGANRIGVGLVGVVAGSAGGLLGLGGGAIMVPGLQVIARAPLRTAIAASAAAMCATSGVGAVLKIATLGQHGLRWTDALAIAAAMGLPAMLLAPQGARLAHSLPIRWVRACIGLVLLVAAARLAGVI